MIRIAMRWLLALGYAAAGVLHLVLPEPFLRIVPSWVPAPATVVTLTGLAELVGAIALIQPFSRPLRVAGGICLALYALCVWPANFEHFLLDRASVDGGLGLGYHIPRLLLGQPVIIWLALWTSGAIRWPFMQQ